MASTSPNPRWILIAIGVLFVALVGLGAYTVLLQARLSSDITDVDDRLSASIASVDQKLSAAEEKLSADLTRTTDSLTADLLSLSGQLQTRAGELSAQLETLDTTLNTTITDTATEILGDVQTVRTRLDVVRTELAAADTTLGEQITLQGTQISGELDTVSTDVGSLSTDMTALSTALDALEGDTTQLMIETARALLDAGPLYDQVKDSVVEILIDDEVWGSGFVYGSGSRYVVTAWHVVDGLGASSLAIRTSTGTEVSATVAGRDRSEDVAILEIDQALAGITPLPLMDSSQLFVGQPVLVVGSPYELQGTATTGIISALGRDADDFPDDYFVDWSYDPSDMVQFDAAANPGNSGGPVINASGEVVGIVSWGISIFADSGMSFAPSSDVIKTLADSIIGG